ncbi:hypothetical protein N7462_004485 [Penicillium macrosclerotiorum]|uniref:uncharacterized protein n=1 Tax=Penicillium macrosclerotiorum TaxID=303699 RepID=UPI0025482DF6|nr:uncharacterized protein N7462_004485 [Penicillium macrosclerotiorum]KAJ5690093.1 hypothetical protein N7462_004485 [Penicillium macrosclerotiorum]
MFNPHLRPEILAIRFNGYGGMRGHYFVRSSTSSFQSKQAAASVLPQPIQPVFYGISSMTLQFPVIIPFGYFQPSPAKRFVSLIQAPGVSGSTNIDDVFGELKPIQPDQLIGEWDGFVLSEGHPFETELDELNWAGNTFDSTEDVAPLIISKNGERVRFEDWGKASLREMKYRGVVSAALVYDERPVIVYYRTVQANLVAGVMESKNWGQKFYFYLKK